jgi:hypothetical protein
MLLIISTHTILPSSRLVIMMLVHHDAVKPPTIQPNSGRVNFGVFGHSPHPWPSLCKLISICERGKTNAQLGAKRGNTC